MRVAWFPKLPSGNPYWKLLHKHLEALGVVFETSNNGYWISGRWLWRNRSRVQVLHFHWIQSHYAGPGNTVSFRRLFKFIGYLSFARLLGYRIIWTLHDLTPTWPLHPEWGDWLAGWIVAQFANAVIVHCEMAKKLLGKIYHRHRNVFIAQHPHYIGYYPNNMDQATARKKLGLCPNAYVILFFGGIRPNKGLEDLIDAFETLKDEYSNCLLLIVGKPWKPQSYIEYLHDRVRKIPRISFVPQEISDDEVQIYCQAANIAVFTFRRILTSSSVILAMSFGLPVIVPKKGCLPELVSPDEGFIYDFDDPNSLAKTLRYALKQDLSMIGSRARTKIARCTWETFARITLEAYGFE